MASGFIQLRRGLSEHVRDGRLSFSEAALYVFLLMDTNPATGLCYGSAGLFAAIYGISSRTSRDSLEKLEKKGYLRRFPTRGKHGSYPILMNKFRCSIGAMKGLYVNTSKSESYSQVCYEKCDDNVYDNGNDGVYDGVYDNGEESAGSIKQETRDRKQDKKLSPKPKAPVDERFSIFRTDFETHFSNLNSVPAPWDAKEASSLSRWLKANPTVTQVQWRRRGWGGGAGARSC